MNQEREFAHAAARGFQQRQNIRLTPWLCLIMVCPRSFNVYSIVLSSGYKTT